MPIAIFLEGGLQSRIQGDTAKAIETHPLSKWAYGVELNGHIIKFRKSKLLAAVVQSEAEYKAQIEKAEKDKAANEAAQAEAKVKQDAAQTAALEKAAAGFIAQHGPDHANWPEHLRPKAK